MFDFFRRKKKNKILLEDQLEALRNLPVSFTQTDNQVIKELLNHLEREEYEEDPFMQLISVSGTDLVNERDEIVRLSEDIWSFDMECVEDGESYATIIKEFMALVKKDIKIENIKSDLDFDKEKVWISFEWKEQAYEWELKTENDWVDIELLKKLGRLIEKETVDTYFIYFNDGQNLTLLHTDQACHQTLNKWTEQKFSKLA